MKTRKEIKPFWDRVKVLLKARKVSQREFAIHIGISRRTLEGWIYQNRLPDSESLYKIVRSLGITMESLLKGKEDTALKRYTEEAKARKEATKAMDKLIFQLAMKNSRLHGAVPLKNTGVWGLPTFSRPKELRQVIGKS